MNHFKTITSGSLHDITESGIYYLTGAVTDKPIGLGGIYIVSVFNADLSVGLYIAYIPDNVQKQVSIVSHHDNTWAIADITSTTRT